MAKKKQILTVDSKFDNTILGISCHLADYRFVHFLNKLKNFNFIRLGDLEYNNTQPRTLVDNLSEGKKILNNQIIDEYSLFEIGKKEKIIRFPLYLFDDKDNYISYFFISNRCEGELLIQELKHFDYLLILTNKLSYEKLIFFKENLKSIQSILTLTEVHSSFKAKFEDLLFDIEISNIIK